MIRHSQNFIGLRYYDITIMIKHPEDFIGLRYYDITCQLIAQSTRSYMYINEEPSASANTSHLALDRTTQQMA